MKASFTVMQTADPKKPGKSYELVNGALRSSLEGRYMVAEASTREAATPAELLEVWESLTANDCILQGIATHPKVAVRHNAAAYPDGKMPDGSPVVARSNEAFKRPSSPGLLVIDTDQPATLAEVLCQLHDACPDLEGVACVQASSTSARIVDAATGEVLKGDTGTHTIYLVHDASDVPRALVVLHKRLWLAGHGSIKLAETGEMMARSAADLAMRTPSQPLYIRAHLGQGMEQRKVFEVFSNSDTCDFLDTRAALPDLTDQEETHLAELIQEKQRVMQPQAEAQGRKYEQARVAELKQRGMSTAEALALICSASRSRDLYGDWPIIVNRKQITVQDILDAPAQYHGKSCRDPLEPEYGSNTVATIFSNQAKPIIKSHAHGGREYFLHAGQALEAGETADRLDALQDALHDAPRGGYKLLTSRDVRSLPPLRWRVKGVLPEKGVAAIFGQSASGKSFLAFDMAVAIAGGDEWFGCRVNHAPVVYVCLEGEAGFGQRVKAWEKENLRQLPDSLNMVLEPFKITQAQNVDALASVVPRGSVVIVDTLNRAAPNSDENSSKDMGFILEAAKRLHSLTQGLVVLVHHTGKDDSRGMRGHSSLFAAMDAAIEVKREGDSRRWLLGKAKDGIDGDSHPFRLKVVELETDEDGDTVTSCVVVPDEASAAIRQVKIPRGANQKIAAAALKPLFEKGDIGKVDEARGRPCIKLDDGIEVVSNQLACESRRRITVARTTINAMVAGGLLGCKNDFLWFAA